MTGYVARRLASWVPVLLLSSVLVFAMMRILPGDPIDVMFPAGTQALLTSEARAELNRELGLDRSLPRQYVAWLRTLGSGELGTSLRYRRPVLELLGERGPKTAALVAGSTVIAILIAVPVGVLAALRRGTIADWGASALALVGLSIPSFALGTALVLLFAVRWRLVPSIDDLRLPMVTLGLTSAGVLVRYVRSAVIDELPKEYVRTARAKGLMSLPVLVVHVLPNSLPNVITVLASIIGYQLGGVIVVEQVFNWPGLGLLMFESITGRDYAVVQALALVSAIVFSCVNLAADVTRAAIDPRLRDRVTHRGGS